MFVAPPGIEPDTCLSGGNDELPWRPALEENVAKVGLLVW